MVRKFIGRNSYVPFDSGSYRALNNNRKSKATGTPTTKAHQFIEF